MPYLNYAATTPIDEEILKIYIKCLSDLIYPPELDEKSMKIYEQSKQIILNSLGCKTGYELTYTSGGTEANNLAITGIASNFKTKKHFITSKIEHASVYETFKQLELNGHEVTYLDTDRDGIVDLQQLKANVRPDTVLCSIMTVNNEVGTIQPIADICEIVKAINPQALVMTDAVQAIGKVSGIYNMVDIFTISSHKIYAPKGCGCVVYKKNIKLIPQIYGSITINGARPGTQSLPLQVAFAAAVKKITKNFDENTRKIANIKQYAIEELSKIEKVKFNCNNDSAIISIRLEVDALSETIMKLLADYDIQVSTKSVCSTKTNKPSRTLSSLKLANSEIDRTLRISISHLTTESEINDLIDKLKYIVKNY